MTTEPDGSRWLEVHEPLSRNRAELESTNKVPLPITAAMRAELNNEGAASVLERRSGMPVKIGG
jgi:L,D-transpeptidase ErfK/SrfK